MSSHRPLPHRGRAWLLGVVVPVAITVATWVTVVVLLPRIPDPAAVHWGLSGVDRVGSVGQLVTVSAVLSGVSLLVMAVLSLTTGRQALTRRMVLATATGLATIFAGVTLGTVVVQVDAPTAQHAGPVDGWIAASLGLAVVLGVVAGLLAGADPDQPASGAQLDDAPTAPLAPSERAVWTTTVAGLGERTTWLLGAVGIVAAAGLWLLTKSVVPLVVALPLLAGLLVMSTWQVQVDRGGLTARGLFGWPKVHVPAVEVERAGTTRVRPIRQFGGWGLRTRIDGTVGVVVRTGEAIAVTRSGGRNLVVTVDDAASGAALLNTFAERARTESQR